TTPATRCRHARPAPRREHRENSQPWCVTAAELRLAAARRHPSHKPYPSNQPVRLGHPSPTRRRKSRVRSSWPPQKNSQLQNLRLDVKFLAQPSPGKSPITICRTRGNPQDVGDLRQRQPGKITQL